MGQRLILSINHFAILKSAHPYPNFSATKKIMPLKTTAAAAAPPTAPRKLPILLFDVMDTIVRDPFYHDVPAFLGMSMKELLECKHPTAWIEFEKGLINEMEMIHIFFKDGRPVDLEGKRKPDPDFYTDVSKYLKVDPTSCIFIDDRIRNVEAALDAGFIGIQFKNVELLRKDLAHLGIHF